MSTLTSPARPVILNDVFENVFRLYRTSFPLLFAIVAVAQLPIIALQLLLTLTLGRGLPDDGSALVRRLVANSLGQGTPEALPLDRLALFMAASLALGLLQVALVNQLVGGALTNVIVRQHMRQPLSLGSAYRLGWRRVAALFGAGAAATLVGLAITGVALLACWLLGRALLGNDLRALSDPTTATLLALALLAVAAVWAVVLAAVLGRWIFFPQAIVVEDTSALGGLRRSWELTGSAFWRVIGSVALVWMLVLIATGIPTACINFVVQFIYPRPVEDLFVRQIVSLFVSDIAHIAVLPLQISAYAMLYFDLRRRREGYAQGYE